MERAWEEAEMADWMICRGVGLGGREEREDPH